MKNTTENIVYGIHPVLELLKAKKRKLYFIYTTKPEPKAFTTIQRLLPDYVKINYVDKSVLAKMAETTDHQSVVAKVAPFVFRSKFFDPKKSKFLIMLDGIQDPRNLGAILRSSYCTSVDGVILIVKNGAPLNAVALKSSAGLAEHLEIYRAPSAEAAVQELRKANYNIYLSTFDGENALDANYTEPLCLVIGSEGTGISKSILNFGKRITLPQKSSDISYNASVATGILLFIIANQNKRL